jgi:tRNA modification GTPase
MLEASEPAPISLPVFDRIEAARNGAAEGDPRTELFWMFSPDDTIVAIATPPGRGGIGVVRISGAAAAAVAASLSGRRRPLAPRHATLSQVMGPHGTFDRAILTFFPAPHSYTGEDVVEISAHGSPVLLEAIVAAAVAAGARLAEPGEFTFRAFLRGRVDLVQAEAVRDLVESVTPLQARAAFDQLEGTLTAEIRAADRALFELTARLEASLDFPEEGYHFVEPGSAAREVRDVIARLDRLLASAGRGRLLRTGMQVVFAGRTNTGKSSLFNCLAGTGRAIVTHLPGTTRDLVTETIGIAGIPVTLVDTAGINAAAVDPVELEGMSRAAAARDVAAVVMIVLDGTRPLEDDDRRLLAETAGRARVIVRNKSDQPAAWDATAVAPAAIVDVSAVTGAGIEELCAAIVGSLTEREAARDLPAITNVRHASLVARAREALERGAEAAEAGTPEEFVLADLGEARSRLEEVTGARTSEDMLAEIFSKFCIGK